VEGKIKFALIGCGKIAHKHAIALGQLPEAQIVGVYDLNFNKAREFGERYSLPVYENIDKLVEEANPDVFDVLTPSGVHAETVLELVKYKRHFVVEKPLALRLDQIDEILEKCDQNNLKLHVVQQNRFNPPIIKLKEALDSGRFGKLVLGTVRVRWCRTQEYYDADSWRGTWAYDGGVLANQANHHIDMLVWLMGEVESVMAKIATRLVNIEAEDTAVAVLKFKSGALGVIEATTATRPKDLEGSISVLGEKGSVEVGGFFMNELKIWNFVESDPMDEEIWDKWSKVPDQPAWNHREYFKDVIRNLKLGKSGLVDGLEGRKSIELINAIYESAETGEEIFLRFSPKKCRLGIIQ